MRITNPNIPTLSPISLSGFSSVCNKTTQNTDSMGRAGAAPPTYKFYEVFVMALGSKYVDL